MSVSRSWPALLLVAIAILGSDESLGFTICESSGALRSRLFATLIERGDAQASRGRLAEAASYYLRVFQPFQHDGSSYSPQRCAEQRIYQDAADKLRTVAEPHAEQLIDKGHYLTEESPREIRSTGGALNLLLFANSYDAFIEHSLEYAANEIRERDIDKKLQGLVDSRLRRLKTTANNSGMVHAGYIDDTSPLLDEELVAFEKLSGFQERLRTHLKPLYPKITDYWLAVETKNHNDLVAFSNDMRQSLLDIQQSRLIASATGAIGAGITRLAKHPREIKRLQDRANERGKTFMSQEKYTAARAYFKVAGNDKRWAQTDTLVRRDEQESLEKIKAATLADVEKMQKTDEGKAAFEEEAADMAKEFGFDLDD